MQTNARRAIAVTVLEQAPADVTGGLAAGRRADVAAPAASDQADLVVVGAGLSGLAAAHFYRRRFGDSCRVVVLDAAEHVGGMTRRVELEVDGRRLVTFGGAAAFNGPRSWASPVNAGFLAELGIDLAASQAAPRPVRGSATYFDGATFGSERVVPGALPAGDAPAAEAAAAAEVIARFPYAPEQRAALAALWQSDRVTLADRDPAARAEYLARTSYAEFLRDDWRVDPQVAGFLTRRTIGTFGSPAGCVPALDALRAGLPGFRGIEVPSSRRYAWLDEPVVRFDDGLATVTRRAATALEEQGVELRTGRTVVAIRPGPDGVEVDHRGADGVGRIQAAHCVFAAWSRVLPQLLDGLREEQATALGRVVKPPMCYVKAALRSRRPFAELGLHELHCPGAFFYKAELDPLAGANGDLDGPVVVQLVHRPVVDSAERDYRAEAHLAQAALMATTADDYRAAVLDQLGRMLAGTSFEAERDVAEVVVNRWPHTYSPALNTLVDDEATARGEMLAARAPVGRLAIAGVDAHRFGWAQVAIDAAERAVHELPTGAPELGF